MLMLICEFIWLLVTDIIYNFTMCFAHIKLLMLSLQLTWKCLV